MAYPCIIICGLKKEKLGSRLQNVIEISIEIGHVGEIFKFDYDYDCDFDLDEPVIYSLSIRP